MRKLARQLAEWTQHGLINAIQADEIARYEATRPNAWMVYGFIALGSTVIGIGIISLVAANWAEIPDWAKLGGAFCLLLVLAGSIWRVQQRPGVLLLELQLACFLLACMATIGLIGQIYHRSASLSEALLFWSLIVFPAATLSRQHFIPLFWTSIFLASGLAEFWEYVVRRVADEGSLLLGLSMVVPFALALVAVWLGKVPWLSPFAVAFRYWAFIIAGMGVVKADLDSLAHSRLASVDVVMLLPAVLLGLLTVVTVVSEKRLARIHKQLLTAVIVLYLAMLPSCQYLSWRSTGAVYAILIAGVLAILVGLYDQRRLFNLLTAFVGLRFVVIYFSAIGGLARTGLGLIVSGLLILGCVLFWHRRGERLRLWLLGLAP